MEIFREQVYPSCWLLTRPRLRNDAEVREFAGLLGEQVA